MWFSVRKEVSTNAFVRQIRRDIHTRHDSCASERRWLWFLAGVALFCAIPVHPANAQVTNVLKVNATANIFGAGLSTPPDPGGGGAGTLPSSITLSAGAAVVTFSAEGLVCFCPGCPTAVTNGPDGQAHATDISSCGGISGIRASTTAFLTGVFLASSGQPSNPPPTVDFSESGAIGASFTNLSPALGQTFFIGDGLTGTGNGIVQTFYVPPGATTLYLGFADGFNIAGPPGWYGDNTGSLSVSVAQEPPALRAYWTFDEGSGSIAYDSSGNSNTGAVSFGSAGAWTSGMVNGALSFDGDGARCSACREGQERLPLRFLTPANLRTTISGKF